MPDEQLRLQYFAAQLQKGADAVLKAQREAAGINGGRRRRKKYWQRSAVDLLEVINKQSFVVHSTGDTVELSVKLPLQLRFLDMKRLGNYRVYNRPVWNTLYRRTLQDIKYEYRDWLRQNFPQMLGEQEK